MGKKTKKADAAQAEATATNETTAEVTSGTVVETQDLATEPEAPKKKRQSRKLAIVAGTANLADISAGYLAHMESEGKSDGTISSYRMELKTAMDELGAGTPIASLTPDQVNTYFESRRVTKLRSGKNKAKPSVDKTRRVLRLALVWAAERGIVERAPLPEPANA